MSQELQELQDALNAAKALAKLAEKPDFLLAPGDRDRVILAAEVERLGAALAATRPHVRGLPMFSAEEVFAKLAAERNRSRLLIEQCRAALAEELAAWEIDPPLHHVKAAHDACVAWLERPNK